MRPPTPERKFRVLMRDFGFRTEAVSLGRSRNDEHTAVVCYPTDRVGEIVELFTRPHNRHLEITRIHIPPEGKYGQPAVRVYVRWAMA